MKPSVSAVICSALLLPWLAAAQLSGTVGPTTSRASKAATKVCNILSYGGVASATHDNGPAIASAWASCKTGGEVYIPSGSYGLGTWVTLSGGSKISINLEGTIYRTGTAGGNMILIEHTTDFEFYSANSKGAIQGYGYTFLSAGTYGPRIMRVVSVTDFSIHGIVLVDSPAFHLTLDSCTNGEVYNLVIRGSNKGGLDGMDIWGTNLWVHDVEVTNKDECVTIKNPSHHFLIENIFCNWSGGCAMGSLGAGTDISYITYNHIYTQNANQMFMIKSNGGSGTVTNCQFNNFMGHSNAYMLDINAFWSVTPSAGNGISYSNLVFNGWKGTASNGLQRAPIQVICPPLVPCKGITIESTNLWTESGSSEKYVCENAYGSGGCLKGGTVYTTYTTVETITAMSNYSPTKMSGELTAGLGLTKSIPIPTIPASFYPGIQPYSALL